MVGALALSVALSLALCQDGYSELVDIAQVMETPKMAEAVKHVSQLGEPDYLESRRKVVALGAAAIPKIETVLKKPIHWPAKSLESKYDYLWSIGRLHDMLLYQSTVSCADGRPDESAAALVNAFSLSRKVASNGNQMHFQAGWVMVYKAFMEFDNNRKQYTIGGLTRIREEVSSQLSADLFLPALRRSLTEIDADAKLLRTDPVKYVQALGYRSDELPELSPNQANDLAAELVVWSRHSMAVVESIMKLPEPDREAAFHALHEDEASPLLGKLAAFFPLLSGDSGITTEQRRIKILRLARLHCLILEYRWKRGALPVTLEDLGKGTSLNPATGKAYGYRLTGKNYVLTGDQASESNGEGN